MAPIAVALLILLAVAGTAAICRYLERKDS